MSIIKEITKGKYTLVHKVLQGAGLFGEDVNSFEVYYPDDKGIRYTLPVHPPVVVSNFTKEDNIFKLDTYTDKDYQETLEKSIKTINV